MFFLLNSIDQNVIGKTEGDSQVTIDSSRVKAEFSVDSCLPRQVHKYFGKCQSITPLKVTSREIRLTDFCSGGRTSGKQSIVSPKVKSILRDFSVFSGSFLPVQIFDHEEVCHPYYLLNFQETLTDVLVDFEKTVYSVFDKSGVEVDEITGQLEANKDQSLITRVKRFAFKEKSELPDLFVSDFTLTYFVSSRLAERLAAEEVSGINIYEYDNQSDLGFNTVRKANNRVY